MAEFSLVLTKFLHVLGAVLWLGWASYQSFLHMPSIQRLEGKARLDAMAATLRRSGPLFGITGLLTILLGLELGRQFYGTMNVMAWWTEPVAASRYVFVGFWLSLAALGLGVGILPQRKKLDGLAAGAYGPETEERAGTVYVRVAMLGHTMTLLLVIIVATMVAANLGGL